VISTVDPDTRHVHKTVHRRQDGYKAHLAVEPDTGIITDCALTKANGADNHEAAVGLRLLGGEDKPVIVVADSAYGSGEFRAEPAERGHVDRVKPAPVPRIIPDGFTVDDFAVDHDKRTATCPNGLTRPIGRSGVATFGVACATCRLRARCTRSRKGKQLVVGAHDARQRAARQAARDPQWLADYRQHRPMIERTIAWLTRGNRRLRYRGITKNDHWLHHRAAALNLRRLVNLGLAHSGTAWALA
jgi:IS5 family transposase